MTQHTTQNGNGSPSRNGPCSDRVGPVVLGLTTPLGFAPGDLTSPARAAEAHALVDVHLDRNVTELRIHGVAGSNGPTMLEHPVSVQVAGDRKSGFHRRWTWAGKDSASAPWRLEAYSWGGLTEGRLASASWLLLGPFMLYNVAHFMLPARARVHGQRDVSDAVLRLIALSATLQLVTALVGMLLDTAALQAGGRHRLPALLEWPDGVRATVSLLAVLLAVGVLVFISYRTTNDYEKQEHSSNHAPPEDIRTSWPLTDTRFWRGKEVVDRQRALHMAVTCAWVTIIAAVLGPSGWWHRVCLGAGAVVLLGSAALTASQLSDRYTVRHQRHRPDEPPATWLRDPIGTPQRRIGLTVVAATITVLTLGVDAADGTWTGRYYVTEHLSTLWNGLIVTQLGLLAVLGLLVWPEAHGRRGDDPGPGPFLRGHLSTVFVALAVLLGGVLSAVVAIGFARLFGDPVPSGQGGAAGAVVVPWPLYAFAAAPLVIPAAAILAAILLVVRFCTQRRHYYNQVDMAYPKPRASADTNRRKIAAAWAAADLTDDVGRVVAVVTMSGWAVVASVALALDRGRGGQGGITDKIVSTGSLLAVLIAVGLVALLRSAYAGGARRREIGSVWDVGTFWPRAAHPLAPPCYAERAVPEVVDRIRELTGRIPDHPDDPARTSADGLTVPAGPVLLTGYSQGSILAPAVVAQLPPDARVDVALLTLACPARRLYGRAFPDFFGPEQLRVLARLMTGEDGVRRWTNVVRRSDYIGSWVGRCDRDTTTAVAGLEDVDEWIKDPVALVPDERRSPVIHRHSGWWPDPQVCEHAERLVDLLDPGGARGMGARPISFPEDLYCGRQIASAVGSLANGR
jgi:hypothetical protein